MPRMFPAITVLCAVLALACGGGDEPEFDAAGTRAAAPPTFTPTATLSPEEKPTEVPTPSPDKITVSNEAFSMEGFDGTILQGHLYTPSGPKRQALIILAPVEQSIWAESTQTFTREGIAVLTFDMRGYGETGGIKKPETTSADVRLAARFLNFREYPLVYVLSVGEAAGEAATDNAARPTELTGLITYGYGEEVTLENHESLAPDAAWSGEDVLAIPEVRDMVLTIVKGED